MKSLHPDALKKMPHPLLVKRKRKLEQTVKELRNDPLWSSSFQLATHALKAINAELKRREEELL